MNSAIERLLGLRVKDIMNKKVMTIAEASTMQTAARQLYENQVTGAPVVNSAGSCVGVVSGSDYVAWGADSANAADDSELDIVATHMTPLVQTIDEEATIMSAARLLCNEGIHRLVVADEDGKPMGILSTLDLVASLVACIEDA